MAVQLECEKPQNKSYQFFTLPFCFWVLSSRIVSTIYIKKQQGFGRACYSEFENSADQVCQLILKMKKFKTQLLIICLVFNKKK